MSIYIIAAIAIFSSALVCYALISQMIEKKRIQKQRILMALKTKQRNFVYMINGFPANFLPSELLSLLYRALIDTCEQLREFEPREPRHLGDIELYTNQMSALANANTQRIHIENPQQMKEIHQHLLELQRFVLQQATLKLINQIQFDTYINHIKRLSLQMSVDTYLHHGKQAQQNGKARLAIHYFSLARKLLSSENETHTYDKQIAQLNNIIEALEEKARLSGESEETPVSAAIPDPVAKEWEGIKPATDESWKRKQVYD